MEERVKSDVLKPILALSLKRQDIQMLESIQPDVEHLLLQSLDLAADDRFEECVGAVQAVLDVTWEALNTGHWSLVPDADRAVYAAASLLKVVALVSADCAISRLRKALRAADLGLLLGNAYRQQLTSAAQLLTTAVSQYEPEVELCPSLVSPEAPRLEVAAAPVTVLHCPSLETFSAQHFYPRTPAKLTGCMGHWEAPRRWSLEHLLRVAGNRTVPVELGARYSDAEWSQQLMPLREFISQYVSRACGERGVGYLAQHPLFDQVPELKRDIVVPDYCACSDDSDGEGGGEVDINAWFGPGGTVSPLHYDPKHNLFCQVVGRKRVVLYPPCESDGLYPHEGRLLSNTAQVDPEAPDYAAYPRYRDTNALVCVLEPGEMLYIPPTWWHHVRSFEMSFSVSFWWT